MINIYIVVGILFLHFVFDFICQSDVQGKGKSSDIRLLLQHTFIYSILWFIPSLIYGITFEPSPMILFFAPITFVLHTITDYYTSRIGKQLLEEAKVTNNHHDFFVNIGFDQWLHQLQLILTFYLLT